MAWGELLGALFELASEVFMGVVPEKPKLQRNIDRLRKEQWFQEEYDFKLWDLIEESPELRKYLKKKRNVRRLLRDPYERNYFTQMIKTMQHQFQ